MNNKIVLSLVLISIFSQFATGKSYIPSHDIGSGDMTSKHIGASPNGQYLVAGLEANSNTVMYDGEDLGYTYENTNQVSAVAVNEKYVLVGNHGDNIEIREVGTWKSLYNTTDSYYTKNDVVALAVSSDEVWWAAGCNSFIDLFQTDWQSKKVSKTQDNQYKVTDFAFSRDSAFLASASSENVCIFQAGDKATWDNNITLQSPNAQAAHVDFSTDYLAIAHGNETIEILNVTTWEQHKVITLSSGNAIKCTFSKSNDDLAVATDDGNVFFYSAGSFEHFQTLGLDEVNDIAFSQDSILINYKKGSDSKLSVFKLSNFAYSLYVSLMLLAFLTFTLV